MGGGQLVMEVVELMNIKMEVKYHLPLLQFHLLIALVH